MDYYICSLSETKYGAGSLFKFKDKEVQFVGKTTDGWFVVTINNFGFECFDVMKLHPDLPGADIEEESLVD